MGRVGVPKRATKRTREAGQEFEEMRDKEVTKHVMAEKPDEQLFFLDRGQRKLTRSELREIKRQKYIAGLPGGERSSELEEKLIKRLAATVGKAGAKGEEKGEFKKPVYDMWGQEEKKSRKRKKKAAQQKDEGEEEVALPPPRVARRKEMVYKGRENVRLAPSVHPGQSYNPLEAHHEDIVQQAVAVEEAREAAMSEARKPIPAMSDDTYALLLSSDDEDDGDDDNDKEGEEAEDGAAAGGLKKRKGKLTKAQRNRMRRHKLTEQQARLQKERKALEKQANRSRELAKALDRQEPAAAEEGGKKKRKRGAAKKEAPVFTARALAPLVLPRERNPIQRRSVDAPLTEELAGSLRLVHPVGSLATDQLEALQKGGRYELTATHRKHRRVQKKVKYIDKRDMDDKE